LGEILSTIELMMQRTQGMSLSPEEKKNLHMEGLRKKAKGFFMKLVESPDNRDEIVTSLDDQTEGDSEILKALIWNDMVENMPGRKAILNHIDTMEKLPHARQKDELLRQLRSELNSGMKNLSKDLKIIANAERKKLAAFGISGSAVVPNVSTDSLFEHNMASVIDSYKYKLLNELV
jgi:hypothetical protein